MEVIREQQQLYIKKQQQEQLADLFEQGLITFEHFECALKMLDSGKTNRYLEGLLSKKLTPEVFGRFFKCDVQR
jgi:hypothetical protein